MEDFSLPKYLLLDVDGTIWKLGKILPGIPESIAKLKEMGIKIIILTNNTSLCRKDFANKLVSLGIADINEDDIFSSGFGCAFLMKKDGIRNSFVVGFPGLKDEIRKQGIKVNDLDSDEKYPFVDAIALANSRSFTFSTLSRICTIYRKSPGCKIFGANPDMDNICAGRVIIGGGTIVATTEEMLRVKACNVGKPSEEMMYILKSRLNSTPEEMMIVGDRLSTDVEFGNDHGIRSVFVLSGVDKDINLKTISPQQKPTYVLNSLADLPQFFIEQQKKHLKIP